jgi:hypothetical protein
MPNGLGRIHHRWTMKKSMRLKAVRRATTMTIDIEKSGFSLVTKKQHQRGEVWNPDQGSGEWHPGQDLSDIRRLYNIDKAAESDIPFVEFKR